jgi:hypothetical protein
MLQCRRKLFFNEGRRPEEIFKFRVSEKSFPGLWGRFDRILLVRKQRFSMSKFTICLQFSCTKWAKAYLINYILECSVFIYGLSIITQNSIWSPEIVQ